MRVSEEQMEAGLKVKRAYATYLSVRKEAEREARKAVARAIEEPYEEWVVATQAARDTGLRVSDLLAAMGTKNRATVYKALNAGTTRADESEDEPW